MVEAVSDAPIPLNTSSWNGWFGPHRISVVVPALNEAENLKHVLPRIPDWIDEVILVDGRSTDDTIEVALRSRPNITVVRQNGHGKGCALRQGFEAATGDVIVTLDADGSTDPAEIPLFVGALLAGADFAKGTRFGQGGGSADLDAVRRLGNWGFTVMYRVLFRNRCTDLCYGYNAFWATVVPRLRLDADGFDVETQMHARAVRAGLKVVEVPSYEGERYFGASNLRVLHDGWQVLKVIVREWCAATALFLPRSSKERSKEQSAH